MTDFSVPAMAAVVTAPTAALPTAAPTLASSAVPSAPADFISPAAVVFGCFLGAVGLGHFAFRRYFRSLIPGRLAPAATLLVLVSGLAEILLAALLFIPETRSIAAWGAAALITGYMVSHVDALVRADRNAPRLLDRPAGAVARIVVNLFYIAWAVAIAILS
ncbi:hypothetical protein [Nocardiopsis composta]|uniref:Putative membrane protein n=1 Tax=Nocardiopsis composta TaxID=157465 RepID=A0A7W8QMG2_9ACTN|nr:hypothetical protein [Nocardiopsis composta]MBB5432979.1 putative membrane protein [Nocardiopsis composta]